MVREEESTIRELVLRCKKSVFMEEDQRIAFCVGNIYYANTALKLITTTNEWGRTHFIGDYQELETGKPFVNDDITPDAPWFREHFEVVGWSQ